jgi:hypothetical protein
LTKDPQKHWQSQVSIAIFIEVRNRFCTKRFFGDSQGVHEARRPAWKGGRNSQAIDDHAYLSIVLKTSISI